MSAEFDLIKRFFTKPVKMADVGIGDDAALIRISPDCQLVISVDSSVVGTHFFAECAPYWIGWKSLAVNVSDMAAMGAIPKWITLAIALPEHDEIWLTEFSRGFFACAEAFGLELIGGDTTRGQLNITVQIMGEVVIGQALLRSGAKPGDDIWVSGQLGSAALGLAHLQKKLSLPEDVRATCLNALHSPQPRVGLGLGIQTLAHSCIDISDGLLADLGHILEASGCGADIKLEQVPCIDYLRESLHLPQFQQAVLAGGDDYELCFTAPSQAQEAIIALGHSLNLPLACIGKLTAQSGLRVSYQQQQLLFNRKGFDHFAST